MAENLAKRVGRIISGSINAVVDAVESAAPDIVMEQAIREIDTAIDEVRAELGKVIAAKHLASKRLADKGQRHEDLNAKIEVAVEQGRDDLAEAAISHQLDIEAQIPVLEQTIAECGENEKELEGYIAALQAKKREMREELNTLRATLQACNGSTGTAAATSGGGVGKAVTDAGDTFDRVMSQQIGATGSASSNMKNAAQLAELEQLARDNRIRERLAAIKSNQN